MANPTGPFEIEVKANNVNGTQSVIAEAKLERYMLGNGTSVSDVWTTTETITPGEHVFIFSNLPSGVYKSHVRFYPTEENEMTINPSPLVQIFTSLDTNPVEGITNNIQGTDTGGKTLYGNLHQAIGEDGTDWRDISIFTNYNDFTSSANFPISYNGSLQHRIEYKLVAGENTIRANDHTLYVGGQEAALIKVLPYGNTGELDFRGCRIVIEPDDNPNGPWEGTFDLEMELQVFNPQKNEWSAYASRIRTVFSGTFTFVLDN